MNKQKALSFIKTLSLNVLICIVSAANVYAVSNIDYAAFPPSNSETAAPLVMFTLSRDHQYFFKAYNDYTDLDPEKDDGVETTYDHDFDYYGYFDPEKCYNYDTSDERFKPQGFQNSESYCDGVSGNWSGNFLNWATMTRMDVFRKILYGGYRSTDTKSLTVLERAFLPTDAHSFAKYYNGTDIGKLTPFSDIDDDNNEDGVDDLNEGITICNTTYSVDNPSHTSNDPPLMRMAQGNYQLWATNERWQCTWKGERGTQFNANIADGLIDKSGNPVATTVEIDGEEIDVRSGLNTMNRDPLENESYNGVTYDHVLKIGTEKDIVVRIEVCSDNDPDANKNNERCAEYPDGNYKPTGLLHAYGETGLMNFGLMTGSFTNNTRGGVLRKNISNFGDEVNVDTDGTFTGANGFVKTLDLLRIYGYIPKESGVDNPGSYFPDKNNNDCKWALTEFDNGTCNSWGNPISEIAAESLRYISGKTANGTFNANDNAYIAGLTNETWSTDLITESNQCAPLNQVIVNASVSSYDSDNNEISITDLNGSPDVNGFTDKVGDHEGITDNNFFVGSVGDNDDDFYCTSKTVENLSTASGLCPEGPTVEGSYAMAGIAYYAKNADLYPDLEGTQNLTTYGITLATNSPVIRVPYGDSNQITILPAYRLLKNEGGGGALVDFKIVTPHTETSPGIFEAKYYINWEDSEQGGDFDMDMWGILSYVLDKSANTIEITTNAVAESTGTGQLFGFVTSGTTEDGFHAYSGIEKANYVDPHPNVPGCDKCEALYDRGNRKNDPDDTENYDPDLQQGPQSHTFTLNSNNNTKSLESPLFYAAKYGSFDDDDANGADDVDEWDLINNITGEEIADGVPDHYFEVTNPGQLETSLGNALAAILSDRTSSGSAPANLANADGTGGIIVQAVYFDSQKSTIATNQTVSWTGQLHAFFIDEFGLFREDHPTLGTQGQLDDPSIDKVFTYSFEEDAKEDQLKIKRYDYNGDGDLVVYEIVSAQMLNTIWSADEILSSYDNDDIEIQRTYGAVASNTGASRYVFTWFDKNRNHQVDDGEQVPFEANTVDSVDDKGVQFGRYLSVTNMDRAKRIVDFIRGQEGEVGTRSRVLTEDDGSADGVDVVKRLGDVINSAPHIVATPSAGYDTLYGDTSYTEFRRKYANRREVMYIGGNDGLLHAFNVGFRNASSASSVAFQKNNPNNPTDAEHALGAELWAYAPYNLLPHLQWLSEPNYSHVYYVDGAPKSYDVNIFDDDEDHPNGWGTILVVGMRLGGGQFQVNLDDDNSNNIGCTDWCARSAYIVLDITNPEKAPVVMAEINDNSFATFTNGTQDGNPGNDLFHTSQIPALVKIRKPGLGNNWLNPTENDWKLVFGSGPKNIATLDTGERARIYEYDLVDKTLLKANVADGGNTNISRSFVGGLLTKDWNNDFQDDVVYFGTVGKTSTSFDTENHKGSLFRYIVQDNASNAITTNRMYNINRPVSTVPIATTNRGRKFVHFGTGRFLYQGDIDTTAQEYFVGLMEPVDISGESDYTDKITDKILDVTNITVLDDDDSTLGGTGPSGVDTFSELQSYIIDNTNGWRRELDRDSANGVLPNERVSSDPISFGTQLLYTAFTPTNDICLGISGDSKLSVLNLITGTASDFGGLGFNDDGEALTSISVGSGRSSSPQVFIASGLGPNQFRVIIQQDTGELANDPDETGAPIVSEREPLQIERVNWREIRLE